jgi:carbonic anhydrase
MQAHPARWLRATLTALACAGSLPALGQATPAAHWTYDGEHGPAHWGALATDYETCKLGTLQSPIDIRGAKAAPLPAIGFAYKPSPLQIVDNGHTVQVTYAPGSFITVGEKKYELLQFHFHHPAEEKVNGKSYPFVAHLVHKSAEGKLAVVAVLMVNGKPNPIIAAIWKSLSGEKGKESAPEGVTVNVADLLPAERGYYTFIGSLTTPPCSEGVTWFVLKTPAQVSRSEVAVFARLFPNNTRPIQPLNGRLVEMTE